MTSPRPVSCPRCAGPSSLNADNAWRPFCSERCKLLDLGQWFAEQHAIPADPDGEPFETPSESH